MSAWLATLLARLAASPALQGLVAALATFVLEDPTTVGCGLLVAERKMAFTTALVGVSAGIAIGDVGLYALGRLVGPRLRGRGPLTAGRLERAERWFGRNLVVAVALARFVPGMRLPTYVGAGLLRASLARFAAVAVAASLVWTFLLLHATVALGEAVLPALGRYRWPAAAIALLVLALVQRATARRLAERPAAAPAGPRVLSRFELWPPVVFYLPVAVYWLWLALRHRGLLLPTAANPTIEAGGLIGESKAAILDLVPGPQRALVAPYVVIEAPAGGAGLEATVAGALEATAAAGIDFPLVAKPDVGQRGAGVWPLADEGDLRAYLAAFPSGERLLLQQLVGDPAAPRQPDDHPSGLGDAREAGIMYWRRPGEERGHVPSMTLKLFPELVGDGVHSILELIERDPRARRLARLYRARHRAALGEVLDEGRRFPLVFAGNHCRGTVFRDACALVTPELEARVEEIARSMPGFDFGRFDVRFDDLAALLRGDGFAIVEINGAGAEATHIWDASTRLGDAYRSLFEQLRVLFEIAAANRRAGHRPLGLGRFVRKLLAYRRLARAYPVAK